VANEESILVAERFTVIKADDDRRFLLTVAYPAFKPDAAIAVDGHIDVASADVVERACWRFMRKGAKMGMWHQEESDEARVVENYIYRGPTWVIKAPNGSDQKIESGDWLVGIICSPRQWAMYKAGMIGGVSPQGGARRAVPSQATLDAVRRRLNGS
jgi:hypothetical protein